MLTKISMKPGTRRVLEKEVFETYLMSFAFWLNLFSPIAVATGSKTYILRSVLDPAIIEFASRTDESILEEEIVDEPDDQDLDDASVVRSYGSLIAWSY